MRSARIAPKLLSILLLLSFALISQASVSAQTGAPPPVEPPIVPVPDTVFPPGTVIVEPTIITVPPPGIEPLTEPGVIVQLVAAPGVENAVAPVTPPFEDANGNAIEATIYIPLGTEPTIGRIEQVPLDDLITSGDLTLPADLEGRTVIGFSLDIFTTAGGTATEETDFTDNPIVPAFPVADPNNPPVLLHYDPVTGELTPVPFHVPEDDPTNTTGIVTNPDGTQAILYDITDTTGIYILAV